VTLTALALGLAALQTQTQTATPDPNDPVFQNAWSQLAQEQQLYLQLAGTVTYHGKQTVLGTDLYWSSTVSGTGATASTTYQVDIESHTNGVLTKRIVGDGNTLWSYDMLLHQYSATSYGGTPGLARPTNYLLNLLESLNLLTMSNDAYLTKLLRQIYNPANTTNGLYTSSQVGINENGYTGAIYYSSWMPGVPSYQLLQGNQVADPVNPAQVYYPSASADYYAYNASPKRTIVFLFSPGTTVTASGTPPVSGLTTVYFNQAETLSGYTRLVQWTITPQPVTTFSTSLFLPYTGQQIQGWRPVVAPKPVTH